MKIILSPAKKMRVEPDILRPEGLPVFLEDAKSINEWMNQRSFDELKKLWNCNDSIALENYQRHRDMDFDRLMTPAILAYDGIAYQYMAPNVFEYTNFDYVQEHLKIISGFYGVLKPMDGVSPYRLEMQAKAKVGDTKDLYEFWGKRIYEEIIDADKIIVNLASKEYSRCIEAYLTPDVRYITCIFGEIAGEKVVQKGVYAKMARGQMVRWMAERNILEPEGLKEFSELGYSFDEKRSDDSHFVFIKEGKHA